MRTLAAVALLFVLTGTSSGASITPTPERSAIYGCIERETRAAVESKWGQNNLRVDMYMETVVEEVKNESGEVSDFQKSIWQECSQRLPRDAALIGQNGAAAWVRKILDEVSFEEDKEAYGEQKASEMRDLNQAGKVYDKCLEANARSLALASAEPAGDTLAKAVFAACGPQRVLLEAARYKYGGDGREFAERYDQSFVGDIILDIIKARAPAKTAIPSAKKLQ